MTQFGKAAVLAEHDSACWLNSKSQLLLLVSKYSEHAHILDKLRQGAHGDYDISLETLKTMSAIAPGKSLCHRCDSSQFVCHLKCCC